MDAALPPRLKALEALPLAAAVGRFRRELLEVRLKQALRWWWPVQNACVGDLNLLEARLLPLGPLMGLWARSGA